MLISKKELYLIKKLFNYCRVFKSSFSNNFDRDKVLSDLPTKSFLIKNFPCFVGVHFIAGSNLVS